jgi:hypothetical protein
LVADIEDRRTFRQLQAAIGHIGDDNPAGQLGSEHGQGDQVLLALEQRLRDTVGAMAAGHAAENLRNDEGGHVDFGIFLAVFHQRAGDLFRCHQADIGDEVAVDGVRHVDIKHNAGEVSAVVEEQIEVSDILAVIEDRDEALILLRGAVYLEAVDGPVVSRSDHLGPLTFGWSAAAVVRGEIEQMLPTIGITQGRDLVLVHRGGNIAYVIDCIEIPGQRYGDPIIAGDLVIAADDDAILALVAGPKDDGRVRADVIQVDGGMAGWIHCAELTVGLFHQQGDGSARAGPCSGEAEQDRCDAEKRLTVGPANSRAVDHPMLDANEPACGLVEW